MKPTWMRIVNWLLYMGFCALTGTGLLLSFRLVPGSRGGRGLELLGWGRHDWGDVHLWIACAVIGLTVIHLVLNWAWMKKVGSYGCNWRMLTGVGVGLVIVVVFIFPPITRRPRGDGAGWGPEHGHELFVGKTP